MAKAPKVSPGISAYLRFLNMVEAVRGPTFPELDSTEERLLSALGAAWHGGRRVPILEAMNLLPDSSTTTLHRRINSLRQKGLLTHESDPLDSRVKYLAPTPAALEYFETMGRCLKQASAP